MGSRILLAPISSCVKRDDEWGMCEAITIRGRSGEADGIGKDCTELTESSPHRTDCQRREIVCLGERAGGGKGELL